MGERKNPVRLLESTLTGQIYVVTRYSIKEGKNGPYLVAHTKYDVTADFDAIVANRATREANDG